MIPVLTIMGLQFANLITGTIVVENVFVLPGVGRLVFQAIANRDLVVVRDVVHAAGGVVVAGQLRRRRAVRAGRSARCGPACADDA